MSGSSGSVRRSNRTSTGHLRSREESRSGRHRGLDTRSRASAGAQLFVALDHGGIGPSRVGYADRLAARRSAVHVCLLEALHPAPGPLATSKKEVPSAQPTQLEADARREWVSRAQVSADRDLREVVARLHKAGLQADGVKALCCEPEDEPNAIAFILEAARQYECRTIILGRPSPSEFQPSFRRRLGAEILRRGRDISVWAIP